MRKYLFITSLFVAVSLVSTFGQQSESAVQERERLAQKRLIDKKDDEMRRESSKQLLSLENWNEEMNYRKHLTPFRTLSKEELAKIKAALAANPEDLAKYKKFIQQPNTGLFRLMPNLGCSQKYVVRADEDCADSTFRGEYYSFRKNDYVNQEYFDLTFKNGEFISRSFLSQAILTTLGDVELENISLESNGLKFLTEFKPEIENDAVKKQFKEIAAGIKSGNYVYAKNVKATPDTTYAVRIVAYRPDDKIKRKPFSGLTAEGFRYFGLKYDKRIDLTLVFRIIRQDANGSLSILWKELSRKEAPAISFRKDELVTDNNK
jgi:hypothetical protein